MNEILNNETDYLKQGNFTEFGKSLFRERTKRINKETNMETFITAVKSKNETKDVEHDNIG